MKACPRCGGPTILLFTGFACQRECDLRPADPPGTTRVRWAHKERLTADTDPLAAPPPGYYRVFWGEDEPPPFGWTHCAWVSGHGGVSPNWDRPTLEGWTSILVFYGASWACKGLVSKNETSVGLIYTVPA